tara:strand:- start:18 stop:230 length:213 start_codon:yes stop_codon:yes gene_type:complete
LFAIGAATLLPEPPCSIKTLMEYLGSLYGAKATNRAWSRFLYSISLIFKSASLSASVILLTCEVPVFPAN